MCPIKWIYTWLHVANLIWSNCNFCYYKYQVLQRTKMTEHTRDTETLVPVKYPQAIMDEWFNDYHVQVNIQDILQPLFHINNKYNFNYLILQTLIHYYQKWRYWGSHQWKLKQQVSLHSKMQKWSNKKLRYMTSSHCGASGVQVNQVTKRPTLMVVTLNNGVWRITRLNLEYNHAFVSRDLQSC